MSEVIFFADNYTITPGNLGSVHNPQTAPTGFTTYTDPFSDPLVAVAAGAGQGSATFPFPSIVSELRPSAGVNYDLPVGANGFKIRTVVTSPSGFDNRLVQYSFFFSDTTLGGQWAEILFRWNPTAGSARVTYSPAGGTEIQNNFSAPFLDTTPITVEFVLHVQATQVRVYADGILIRTITADFSWVDELWKITIGLASMTATAMSGFFIRSLEMFEEVADAANLVIQDATHAHTAESIGSLSQYPDFPTTLKCPSRIDGYAFEAEATVRRFPFDAGNTRQRRVHHKMPLQIQMGWRVNNEQLQPLFAWLNQYGYDFFNIELSGLESSSVNLFKTKIPIRLISDINISLMKVHRQNWYILSCLAEYQPAVIEVEAPPSETVMLRDFLDIDRDPEGTIAGRIPDIAFNDFFWRDSGDTTLSIVDGFGAAATGTFQDLIQFLSGAELDDDFVPLGLDGLPWESILKGERRSRSPTGSMEEFMEWRYFLTPNGETYFFFTWLPEDGGLFVGFQLEGEDEPEQVLLDVGTDAQGLGTLTLNITVSATNITVEGIYETAEETFTDTDTITTDLSAFDDFYGARIEAQSGDAQNLYAQFIEVSNG